VTEIKLKEKFLSIYKGEYLYLPEYNLIIPKEMKDQYPFGPLIKKISLHKPTINMMEQIKWNMRNLTNFTFEVTQKCNLRCKYCIYGGFYPNQRSHSNKEINFETARNAIDYIFDLVKKNYRQEIIIGFYGGEPLLNFKTVKKIVKYATEIFTNRAVRFTMTTNGTLLSNEIINYIIRNNFRILVSLDGPKKIHDSKRIFKNGKGSYEIIINNLKKRE